tara:strand:- start:82 stop:687 length:606 start_codon:yes stop_codon:yes gene_type:complete
MKKIVYIIISLNLFIPQVQGSGVLKNAILPGWGFQNLEKQSHQSKKYFLREAIIWSFLLVSKSSSDLFEGYYIAHGIDYADTDITRYDSQYSIDVGNYESLLSYNDAMLRKRLPERVYPNSEEYSWEWDSSNHRLKYKKMLQASRDISKIGDFAIAGLIVHRMVSVINYLYYSRTGSDSKLSSSVLKPDQNTVLFNIKYNF